MNFQIFISGVLFHLLDVWIQLITLLPQMTVFSLRFIQLSLEFYNFLPAEIKLLECFIQFLIEIWKFLFKHGLQSYFYRGQWLFQLTIGGSSTEFDHCCPPAVPTPPVFFLCYWFCHPSSFLETTIFGSEVHLT